MKSVVYGLGILLLVAGTAAAVTETFIALVEGRYRSLPLGTVWYRLHPDTLLALRTLIELRLGSALWTPFVYVLTLPVWMVFAVPGLVLLLLARERLRRS